MAKAYKCDICKRFYEEGSSNQEYHIGRGTSTNTIFAYLDLCPDCSKKLSALVTGDAKIIMQEEEKNESIKEVQPDPQKYGEIILKNDLIGTDILNYIQSWGFKVSVLHNLYDGKTHYEIIEGEE